MEHAKLRPVREWSFREYDRFLCVYGFATIGTLLAARIVIVLAGWG